MALRKVSFGRAVPAMASCSWRSRKDCEASAEEPGGVWALGVAGSERRDRKAGDLLVVEGKAALTVRQLEDRVTGDHRPIRGARCELHLARRAPIIQRRSAYDVIGDIHGHADALDRPHPRCSHAGT